MVHPHREIGATSSNDKHVFWNCQQNSTKTFDLSIKHNCSKGKDSNFSGKTAERNFAHWILVSCSVGRNTNLKKIQAPYAKNLGFYNSKVCTGLSRITPSARLSGYNSVSIARKYRSHSSKLSSAGSMGNSLKFWLSTNIVTIFFFS